MTVTHFPLSPEGNDGKREGNEPVGALYTYAHSRGRDRSSVGCCKFYVAPLLVSITLEPLHRVADPFLNFFRG